MAVFLNEYGRLPMQVTVFGDWTNRGDILATLLPNGANAIIWCGCRANVAGIRAWAGARRLKFHAILFDFTRDGYAAPTLCYRRAAKKAVFLIAAWDGSRGPMLDAIYYAQSGGVRCRVLWDMDTPSERLGV